MREEKAQAATEYLLLVAVGLAILVVGISLVLQIKDVSSAVNSKAAESRAQAIEMLSR